MNVIPVLVFALLFCTEGIIKPKILKNRLELGFIFVNEKDSG